MTDPHQSGLRKWHRRPAFHFLMTSAACASLPVIAAMAMLLTGCSTAPPIPEKPLPLVTVAKPLQQQIVEWDAYTGRIEPVDFVEVRARIGGHLKSVHFVEGQVIQKGQLLFVIDQRPYQAQLREAEARVEQALSKRNESQSRLAEAKAHLQQYRVQQHLAETRYERTQALFKSSATSQDEVDQGEAEFLRSQADVEAGVASVRSAEAAIASAEAAIETARSEVETAQLNLEYTSVTAPITGRISQKFVTEGNLISGGAATSTMLTTIAAMDPIFCAFDASEQEVLKYMRLDHSGKRQSSRDAKNPVFLGLSDESGLPHKGYIDFVDNRFDSATATMRARAVFDNADQLLVPGMFAKLRIPGSAPYDAVLIPESAISIDQSNHYVMLVRDGVVEVQPIQIGPLVHGLRVVRAGLDGSESLIIKGLLNVRSGSKVQQVASTIEATNDGLPNQYIPVPKEDWLISVSTEDNGQTQVAKQEAVQ